MYKKKILVHYLNEEYRKDEKIISTSYRVAKFGTHTIETIINTLDDKSVQMPGIRNLGNTGYMNAIIQGLIYTPLLKNFFVSDLYQTFTHPKSSTLVFELSALFKAASKMQVIRPFNFK